MEEKGREAITAFDTLMTTNHIQMLKVLLSYLPPKQQNTLAVYIKFSELQYTLQRMWQSPGHPVIRGRRTVLSLHSLTDGSLLDTDRDGVIELLDELLPYSDRREKARIQEIKNMLTGMGQLREMMEMMEMLKEMFPNGMGNDSGGMGNILSAMSGADPEMLAQLMQMFSSSGPENTPEKDNT